MEWPQLIELVVLSKPFMFSFGGHLHCSLEIVNGQLLGFAVGFLCFLMAGDLLSCELFVVTITTLDLYVEYSVPNILTRDSQNGPRGPPPCHVPSAHG